MGKLDVMAWGLVLGCLWGLCILVLALVSKVTGRGRDVIQFIAKVYVGYGATVPGSFTGAVWGFIDGAISGMLIAWGYNKIVF
jgi:hypothetical protein